jgi:hypothetical protein
MGGARLWAALGSRLVGEPEVRRVDVTDEDALRAWWDVGRVASPHDQVDRLGYRLVETSLDVQKVLT